MTLVYAMVENDIVVKCVIAWAALVVLASKANQETIRGMNMSGDCVSHTGA
jgi:hypothetical protein